MHKLPNTHNYTVLLAACQPDCTK